MTKREAIKGLYKTQAWYRRVDKMSEAQVIAIYFRAKADGKL